MVNARNAAETLDSLLDGSVKFFQSRSGYRVSLDAILLAHFATVRVHEKIADLGTGNGAISLILAARHASVHVTGIEIQSGMVERAIRNVELNQLTERVRIVQADTRRIRERFEAASFTQVIANPPYRLASSGRISPDAEKRLARHEITGSLGDFLDAGSYLLPVRGRMALVYPAIRAIDVLSAMRNSGIEPKRLRLVHSFVHSEAAVLLVEGIKRARPGATVLPPLVVYDHKKHYTPEIHAMLASGPLGQNARKITGVLE